MTMDAIDKQILQAIDRSNIGYAIFDRRGHVLSASSSARDLLGFSPDAALEGTLWYDLDHDTARMKAQRRQDYEEFIECNQPWQGILRWVWPDGSKRYYDSSATPAGEDRIIIVLNDRTEQISARREAAARSRLTSSILDRLPVGIMLQDLEGTIIYINQDMATRFEGCPEKLTGIIPGPANGHAGRPELTALLREVQDTQHPIEGRPLRIATGPLKGTSWLVHLYPLQDGEGAIRQVLTVEFDRTERVRLATEKGLYQRKLHELQKVEALNRFAGGLAHELSNILHPAGVYARALCASPDREDRQTLLDRINQSVLQAGDILRQTLSMSRDTGEGLKPVDLGAFLRDLVTYARDVAPSGLVYQLDLPQNPIIAMADETELQQVMLNLLVNASDAQGPTGRIRISAGTDGVPPDDLEIVPSSAGPFVWIEVSDEGSGMSVDVRARIFEPFFTTKKTGKGTGLGLAVVQGMVTGWGGVVSVVTAPGKGATFRVWIPQGHAITAPIES